MAKGILDQNYIVEIRGGRPTLMGPYRDWADRRRAYLEMLEDGRQVIYIDATGPLSVGTHNPEEEHG
jgi:hypothetical protein